MKKITDRELILASGSPRRKWLLESAGFSFIVKSREVDESYPEDIPAVDVATFLAKKKAAACRDFLEDGKLLLTADSTVVMNNKVYNKPANRAEAIKMLAELSGNEHVVYTGVCIASHSKEVLLTGISKVEFDPMTMEEITFYIDEFQPLDKAGSYGIQEWVGLCKIKRIEGTYSNIMGLPVNQIYNAVKNWKD